MLYNGINPNYASPLSNLYAPPQYGNMRMSAAGGMPAPVNPTPQQSQSGMGGGMNPMQTALTAMKLKNMIASDPATSGGQGTATSLWNAMADKAFSGVPQAAADASYGATYGAGEGAAAGAEAMAQNAPQVLSQIAGDAAYSSAMQGGTALASEGAAAGAGSAAAGAEAATLAGEGIAAGAGSAAAAGEGAALAGEGIAAGAAGSGGSSGGMGVGSGTAALTGVALHEGNDPVDVFGSPGWGGYPFQGIEAAANGDWTTVGARALQGGGLGPSAALGVALENGDSTDYARAFTGVVPDIWNYITDGGDTMDLLQMFANPNGNYGYGSRMF